MKTIKRLWNKFVCWWIGIHYWQFTNDQIECKCGATFVPHSILDGMNEEQRKELFSKSFEADEVSGGED